MDLLNPKIVVSATQEEADFLVKLFPQLSLLGLNYNTPFFTQHDIRSKAELDTIQSLEIPHVVISNILFEKQITIDLLKEYTLQFVQVYFKSRRRVINIPEHCEPLKYLSDFLFDSLLDEEDSDILRLFDSVGTRQFNNTLLEVCENNSSSAIISSVVTFLTKMQNPTTLFYKKAFERLSRKYKANYRMAGEFYSFSYKPKLSEADNVLLFIKYHSDLFQC